MKMSVYKEVNFNIVVILLGGLINLYKNDK